MTIRTIGITLVSLALAAVPAFASAQYYPNTNHCGYSNYGYTTTNCGSQTLLVYVQVLDSGENGFATTPNAFTVSVSGTTPSPATFSGSLSGTPVTLGLGSYSVVITNALSGFTPSYSTGCSGTIYPNEQGPTCTVTMTPSNGYNSYPTPYPYPYNGPTALTCAPAYQTVADGSSATFTAVGGTGSIYSSGYNWSTANRTFPNIGSTLTTTFQSTGVQSVIVFNGTQTASCTVDVVGGLAPIIYSGTTPTSVVTTYVPALPDTGFAPLSAGMIALSLTILGIVMIAAYPYVRSIALSLLA